ncbi:MAG TPA: ParB/RepB/Spo0J family partition protein [Terriglobales bacterium]|nr:ParB/RepB/Spo0J family partition protein [Terriglobales bacterium]
MAAIEEHKPAEKRRALGRGLDSLLPSGPRVVSSGAATAVASAPVVIPQGMPSAGPAIVPQPAATTGSPDAIPRTGVSAPHGQEIVELSLDLIDENPYQTRRTFDPAALSELAESIKASGLAQPIVVRPGAEGRFILVLGERRCRASKLAGNVTVPAIVRKLGNEQAAEMTVVENLQRQDLNCLEQAQAFARLSREFNLTQEQIGKRTGSSRESVANYMRLLKLPETVLDLIGQGKIGFSEARVLLEAGVFLDSAGIEELARNSVALGWTVKELKAQLNNLQGAAVRKEPVPPKPVDANVKAAEEELQRMLGMRVSISDNKGKGTILIQYRSVEDFEHLLDVLRVGN